MQLHLLLTDNIRAAMPSTIKITHKWGMLLVKFPHKNYYGLHCFVEGEEKDIIDWLKPFDGFVRGDGNPMFETFHINHISDKV